MDLYGWDTVFAADIDTINAALLVESKSLIETFKFKGERVDIAGTFGAWQIVPGGSGKLLDLEITIASGQLTVGEADGGESPVDLSGVRIVVTVALQLLPAPSDPNSKELTFYFDSVKKTGTENNGEGLVVPKAVHAPPDLLSTLQERVLRNRIATCLVENASNVSFVFAKINSMAANVPAWLIPVESDYYYAEPIGTTTQMLAVLSVTSSRDTKQLARKIDPTLLSRPGMASLAISPHLFLEHMLLPPLADSFRQLPGNFKLEGDRLINAVPVIQLPVVRHNDVQYDPKVHSFAVEVNGPKITLSFSGHCMLNLGASFSFSVSSALAATFDATTSKFVFETTGKPVVHQQADVPSVDYLLIVVPGIASAVSDQLAKKIMNQSTTTGIGGIAPKLVEWVGGIGFTVEQAGLETALYLRGHPSNSR